MTKKILLLTLTTTLLLFSYSDNDWDWDGVENKDDKCPQSQFSDLVDKDGCRVASTKSEHHFGVILGVSQLENDEYHNTTGSLQLDYYYRDFALSLSTSQYDYKSSTYDYSDDGQNDYYLSARYKIKHSENLSSYIKGGVIIPADSDVANNKTDYFISKSINYKLNENWNLFGGVNYTFVNNDDSNTTTYQNSFGRYLGVSYRPTYDSTLSLSLSKSGSTYEDEEDIEFIYFSGSYNFTKNWFGIVNLGKEIQDDDKDTYGSLQVGYYF
jgi:hypothetical protein